MLSKTFSVKRSSVDTKGSVANGGSAPAPRSSHDSRRSVRSPVDSGHSGSGGIGGAGGVGRRERLMTSAPGGATREPIGVEKLVELYDDYPRVLRSLEATLDRAEKAEADVRTTEDERDNLHDELERERAARKSDARKAIHETEAATKRAKEEKAAAEKAREDKTRGELQPRIDELSVKLKETTADRDLLRKDLDTMRVQLHSWIEGMERLRKDRQEAEDRERKAAEDRAALMQKTKGFDEQILEGLRLAVKPQPQPQHREEAAAKTVDGAK